MKVRGRKVGMYTPMYKLIKVNEKNKVESN